VQRSAIVKSVSRRAAGDDGRAIVDNDYSRVGVADGDDEEEGERARLGGKVAVKPAETDLSISKAELSPRKDSGSNHMFNIPARSALPCRTVSSHCLLL
jgi:hypothetical protein